MEGIVVKALGLYYTVRFDDREINCTLRGRIRQSHDAGSYSNPIAVGDHVTFSLNDNTTGAIESVSERKNIFSRKEKGRNRKEDIIACNLDLIIVIQSFARPRLNLRFVDRILVRGTKEGIPVLLCVNKADLAGKAEKSHVADHYRDAGIDVIFTSALKGTGIKQFGERILGRQSILVGYSGVGKTSLLNSLFPDLDLPVSEISDSTGKGRHTTTNVQMVHAGGNTRIIDTPGLREFGLMDIEPHLLERYFPEFSPFRDRCEYRPCTHDHEPNCAVKRGIEAGALSEDRYISYLNILHSLEDYYKSMY